MTLSISNVEFYIHHSNLIYLDFTFVDRIRDT
jgi:hypothetical protein